MGEQPLESDYQWPPVTSRDDYKRATLDDELRPYIDGHRVTVEQDQRFRKEWAAFYDASACAEGNCDGEAGHDGPHFGWVAG